MNLQLPLDLPTKDPVPSDPYEDHAETTRIATEEALDKAICDAEDLKQRLTSRDGDVDDLATALKEASAAIQRLKDAITNDQLSLPGIQAHLQDIKFDIDLAVSTDKVA
jgi:predicted  nucleic acid-binding Zn-ribbon protein